MSTRPSIRRRTAASLVVSAATIVLAADPVSAHVHADPASVKPGAKATVAFRISHGCDGSPTVKVAVEVPAGVVGATPVAIPGWKARVSKRVITWSGGRLGADATQRFSITASFPKTKGMLTFPLVQTCVKGENAWIDPTVQGQPEPAHPAPVVGVGVAVHDH